VNIVSFVMRVIDPIRATWNRRDEVGASLVEYALLLALIAMVCIASIGIFGGGVGGSLSKSGSRIVSVGG